MYIFCTNGYKPNYIWCLNGYQLDYTLQGEAKWQHFYGTTNMAQATKPNDIKA